MTGQNPASIGRRFSFGPFQVFPAQQLLLEEGVAVRLGGRGFDILTALVERPGEVVSKRELMSRAWPDTVVDESNLKFQMAVLRRALGDGQPGRRYVTNVPGRGYRFVAPVEIVNEELTPFKTEAAKVIPSHNLPISPSQAIGRSEVITTLLQKLSNERFVTIVGSGGIGKTTVAVAVAEALIPAYEHGVWFVDLAPVSDPTFVPSKVASAFELAAPTEDAASYLVKSLKDRRLLIVLDNCEHVVDAAAAVSERLWTDAPGVHILATSREPLRAAGERVHRLSPLECPPRAKAISADEALSYSAVQLFVERAAARLDNFALTDDDAPIVADICSQLDGIALAIELAAARVDAFGIRQLWLLLNDRFGILNEGKRTARPHHKSLRAALDWSYEFLPEPERVAFRRLSVFAGPFTLESALAVAEDGDSDLVKALANLVAKSLLSVGSDDEIVHYRLLESARAYAMEKLNESGDLEKYVRRHAQHHLDWFKRAESEWGARPFSEWWKENVYRIDDVRAALDWAFSPKGDTSIGLALTVAATPLWLLTSSLHECGERLKYALSSLSAQPASSERDELKLRTGLDLVLLHTAHPLPADASHWMKSVSLGENLSDLVAQTSSLFFWSCYYSYVGRFHEMLPVAERCRVVSAKSGNDLSRLQSHVIVANAMHYTGDHATALAYVASIVKEDPADRGAGFGERINARMVASRILWIQGFSDQAIADLRSALADTETLANPLMMACVLAQSVCPITLEVGNLTEAERLIEMLLEWSAKRALNTWNALGLCLQGSLFLRRGDFTGLALLENALSWLRSANFFFHYTISAGALAQGLSTAGRTAEAHAAIEEALGRVDRSGERWCLPELLRIKGEILRSEGSGNRKEAIEGCFLSALKEAQRQQALSWELRAATSLAELWQSNGKTTEAFELLSGVHGRFSEGFETCDLKKARSLLDELRGMPRRPSAV